jgi:hypothetical protein
MERYFQYMEVEKRRMDSFETRRVEKEQQGHIVYVEWREGTE